MIYYWTRELPPQFNPKAPSLLSLSYYPLKIIVAEWINYANLIHYAVEYLEYTLEDFSKDITHLEGLESELCTIQNWRRRVAESTTKISSLIDKLQSFQAGPTFSGTWPSIIEDCLQIAARMEKYSMRFENMVPVLTALVQVAEGRHSFADTKNITRLTYMPLIFLPLTFTSGLFSMAGDVAPGGKMVWIYFAVALPLVLVVFLLARR
jgi:Mg2+ and Co2+ transporter CorA